MFTRAKWKNEKSGIVILTGDSVEFQNGFGAWQTHTYSCVYDVLSKQVVNVVVEAGRI